jgi:membrane dipeptidase
MKKSFYLIVLSGIILFNCAPQKPLERLSDDQLKAYADELAHKFIITDGHIDLPTALLEKKWQPTVGAGDTLIHTGKGDFDFERAKKGGLNVPFMSIYIPASKQKEPDMGKNLADSLINMIQGVAQILPDRFALANTPAEADANFKAGKISLPMGMENGAPIGNDLKNVKYFFERGIRYITLTHGKDNQICDSSYDTLHTWNGLSPFGEQVVAEMNRVGIMVDISHVNDSAFYDVMKIAKAPCIASHSSCRAFTPGFERNMNDDMIKKLAENGGVIQINYGSSFLDSAYRAKSKVRNANLKALLDAKNLKEEDSLAKPIIEQFKKDNPSFYADVEHVANHIDRVVKLVGIDHVGIGSDYDGVGDSLPTGLKDVSTYPNLIYTLLKRGYTEEDIEKICYKNVWRVWNKVGEVAAAMQAKS